MKEAEFTGIIVEDNIIRCPHCGAEYYAEEIFVGDEFLGTRFATKSSKGKIEHTVGNKPELESSYVCDFCNKKFIVKAHPGYTVEKDDFDEEYSIKI